jgi:hypothetical protein
LVLWAAATPISAAANTPINAILMDAPPVPIFDLF